MSRLCVRICQPFVRFSIKHMAIDCRTLDKSQKNKKRNMVEPKGEKVYKSKAEEKTYIVVTAKVDN